MPRRQGGSVRQLPSRRWQVRIRDKATGRLIPLTTTFATKSEAEVHLAQAIAEQSRGAWIDPRRASTTTILRYTESWIDEHPHLSPRTQELYRSLLRLHIAPHIGDARLADLSPGTIRRWHSEMLKRTGAATTARTYRFLRAVLATAVADEILVRNPASIDGAGQERSPERPIASIPHVYLLAEAVPARHRCLVLVAAFASMRLGELAGLTRRDIDALHGTVRVQRQRQRLADGTVVVTEPKSGRRRTVTLPPQIMEELQRHLAAFVESDLDALVFSKPNGRELDRHYVGHLWRRARAKVAASDPSLPSLSFHDLRHSGNSLAAATGASIRELMARMGHSTMQASVRYHHATQDRDAAIAAALGEVIGKTQADVIPLSDEGRNRAV